MQGRRDADADKVTRGPGRVPTWVLKSIKAMGSYLGTGSFIIKVES